MIRKWATIGMRTPANSNCFNMYMFDSISPRFEDTTQTCYAMIQSWLELDGEFVRQHNVNLIPLDSDEREGSRGLAPKSATDPETFGSDEVARCSKLSYHATALLDSVD